MSGEGGVFRWKIVGLLILGSVLAIIFYLSGPPVKGNLEDSEYRIVYDLVRVVYMNGKCSHLSTHFDKYFAPGLVSCAGGGSEGRIRIRNLHNGTEIRLTRKYDLRVCWGADGNKYIIDFNNFLVFKVKKRQILDFWRSDSEAIRSYNCE
jgi:hypothetical protein